jgi:lipid II:glycine glycyltransferase (peptidoglycan interpeptide bridge formation enzyme)
LHSVDLRPSAKEILSGFHHSTQRAVRRAERNGVTYEAGTSEHLVTTFYGLLRQTRRRHGLPPQPMLWFQNLVASLGSAVTIYVASKDGQPIASIFTISFKKAFVYKYGGSDARYHRFGAMPFLFWNAIQRAKQCGIEELDLGRSDLDQPGLIAFKERLGGTRSPLTYYTKPASRRRSNMNRRFSPAIRWAVARLPDSALDLTGRLLYRHVG